MALCVTALICAKLLQPPPCPEPYTRRVDLGQFAAAVAAVAAVVLLASRAIPGTALSHRSHRVAAGLAGGMVLTSVVAVIAAVAGAHEGPGTCTLRF